MFRVCVFCLHVCPSLCTDAALLDIFVHAMLDMDYMIIIMRDMDLDC